MYFQVNVRKVKVTDLGSTLPQYMLGAGIGNVAFNTIRGNINSFSDVSDSLRVGYVAGIIGFIAQAISYGLTDSEFRRQLIVGILRGSSRAGANSLRFEGVSLSNFEK